MDEWVDVNEPLTASNLTGLHLACCKGDLEAVKLFLEKGADVDSRDTAKRTPLHFAASSGADIEMLRLLI